MSEPQTLRFDASVDIQAAESGKNPKLNIVAYSGSTMNVAGFYSPVVIDFAAFAAKATVPILSDHVDGLPGIVGHGLAAVESGKLVVRGEAIAATETARQVIELAKGGFPFQASVGFNVGRSERLEAGKAATVNGRTLTAGDRGLTIVREGQLKEVSVVALGADANTSVSVAAKKGTATMEGTELKGGTDAERITAIRAKAGPGYADLGLQALAEGWSDDKLDLEMMKRDCGKLEAQARRAELEALRASRASFPNVLNSGGNGGELTSEMIAAAVLIHAGQENVAVKAYGEKTATQARQLRASSMVDICRLSLRADHVDEPVGGSTAVIRAGFSTVSLPIALGDAMHKTLDVAYQDARAPWRDFAAIRNTDDFRDHKSIRPSEVGDLLELGKGGEIKHGTLGEQAITYSVDTYAKMLQITRTDIINDDVSFFSDVPIGMGRAAARCVNDLVVNTILANAGSFFASGNSNYASGGSSALSSSSLTTGVTAMLKQKDAEGRNIDVVPRVLMVPPELKATAQGLLESEFLQQTATLTNPTPTGNPLRNVLSIAVEPRLSNTTRYTSGSTTGWYLFGSPADLPLIVAFLNGQQGPVIESAPAEFNVLGFAWRCYLDVGCVLGDYRAAYKSAGA